MNRKDKAIHVDHSGDLKQERQASAGGVRKQPCEPGSGLGVLHTEDLDALAIESTRLAFRRHHKVTFSELMGIPVLFSGPDHGGSRSDAATQPDSTQWEGIQDALRAWAPKGVHLTLLRRLMWRTLFEHWEPETTRFLLEHALPGGVTFQHELAIPTQQVACRPASRLGFILVLASSERGWPRRCLNRPLEEQRLKAVLRFVLEASSGCVIKPGSVSPASEAIAQGVCDWLTLEIELSGHDSWNLHLDQSDADRRWIHLARAGEPSSLLRVPLRSHLIGLTGLSRITSHVGLLVARDSEVPQ